jgi:hypothetical protein
MEGIVRAHFDHPVDRIFAVLTDPEFLRRRHEVDREKNVVIEVDHADGLVIRVQHDVERAMPGFMKKVFNPVNHLMDVQRWNLRGPVKTSDWTVEIRGQKRIELRGHLSLTAAAQGGCDYAEAFTVTVAIPLIGGRVEKYILGETETLIRSRVEFLRTELARPA